MSFVQSGLIIRMFYLINNKVAIIITKSTTEY